MKQSPSFGGMTTQNTTTVETRDNAYWPDEDQLATLAEQADRTEQHDRMEQTDRLAKDDAAYAELYFVS